MTQKINFKPLKESKLYSKQFFEVARKIITYEKASITFVQREFRMPYPKAEKVLQELCDLNYIEKQEDRYIVKCGDIKQFALLNPFEFSWFDLSQSASDIVLSIVNQCQYLNGTLILAVENENLDKFNELMKFLPYLYDSKKVKGKVYEIWNTLLPNLLTIKAINI